MCGKKRKNKKEGLTQPFLKHFKLVSGRAGFTLIELLIAVTIFSVVASVLYSSFRVGIISWRRIEANLSKYQRIRYSLNCLSGDITNAFMHKGIPFKGEEKRIEFAGFIKEQGAKAKTIGKICYFISNQNGQGSYGALMRERLQYWQLKKEGSEEAKAISGGEEILSDVIDFSINYCYKELEEENAPVQWLPGWKSEETIPIGVKIELVLKDDAVPEGKRTFTKRIYNPTGAFGNPGELTP